MKDQLNKSVWFLPAILIGLITGLWFFKTLYFIDELELSPHKKFILFSSAGFSMVIAAVFFAKKSLLGSISAFLIYFLLSFLLYADVVYERYYDAILHIELAGQANQLGDIADSIVSLMYKTDLLYWADLPVLAVCFYFIYKKNVSLDSRLKHSAAVGGIGIAALLTAAFLPLQPAHTDQYKVSLTGIIPAHIYDVAQSYREKALADEYAQQQKEQLGKLKKKFEDKFETPAESAIFGKYKGKNLIVIQAESLNTFPIGLNINDQEITPNIDSLIESSSYYPNTYLQIGRGNTSDAEFVANNSMYPIAAKGVYQTYPDNKYLSLPVALNKMGYSTSATHGNSADFWNRQEAYREQGYDQFYHINHPEIDRSNILGMGISDESIFNQMADLYKEMEKPFYNFIVTLSVHRPFELPIEQQYLDLPAEFKDTPTGNYLQSVHYFDRALGSFIEELKEENLWDETLFVMYGDHYGLVPKNEGEIKKLLGVTFDEKERFRIPLIIHHPDQQTSQVNTITASQMDIYPTISTLLGIEGPLIQFGESLDLKKEGFAGFAYETTRFTYFTDDYDYIASHDGKFESGTCMNNRTGKKADIESCRRVYNKLANDIQDSKFLLENNLIRKVFEMK
ncbi:LTA synthase family protein [Cytobacillus firmus]|uniref:LTA synthase family protein n=1 Tax=Cytobacillus pseudoceanisediminis TaxID=3051614 RepID=UPI002161CC17|nr:LTA synthase family protein [Cytobacillus firmus]